jgi:hypothetical protein
VVGLANALDADYTDIAKNSVPLATNVLNAVKIMPQSYVLKKKLINQDVKTVKAIPL